MSFTHIPAGHEHNALPSLWHVALAWAMVAVFSLVAANFLAADIVG